MRKKLTLDLEALAVQSFATDEAARLGLGTVRGRQKGSSDQQESECSAADACSSADGCSENDECRPTPHDCPPERCFTAPDCSPMVPCDATVDALCTRVRCSEKA